MTQHVLTIPTACSGPPGLGKSSTRGRRRRRHIAIERMRLALDAHRCLLENARPIERQGTGFVPPRALPPDANAVATDPKLIPETRHGLALISVRDETITSVMHRMSATPMPVVICSQCGESKAWICSPEEKCMACSTYSSLAFHGAVASSAAHKENQTTFSTMWTMAHLVPFLLDNETSSAAVPTGCRGRIRDPELLPWRLSSLPEPQVAPRPVDEGGPSLRRAGFSELSDPDLPRWRPSTSLSEPHVAPRPVDEDGPVRRCAGTLQQLDPDFLAPTSTPSTSLMVPDHDSTGGRVRRRVAELQGKIDRVEDSAPTRRRSTIDPTATTSTSSESQVAPRPVDDVSPPSRRTETIEANVKTAMWPRSIHDPETPAAPKTTSVSDITCETNDAAKVGGRWMDKGDETLGAPYLNPDAARVAGSWIDKDDEPLRDPHLNVDDSTHCGFLASIPMVCRPIIFKGVAHSMPRPMLFFLYIICFPIFLNLLYSFIPALWRNGFTPLEIVLCLIFPLLLCLNPAPAGPNHYHNPIPNPNPNPQGGVCASGRRGKNQRKRYQ